MHINYDQQDELMRALKEIFGSQAAVAKALKVRRQKLNFWLTEAKNGVPCAYLLRMEALLEKDQEEKAQLKKQQSLYEGKLFDDTGISTTRSLLLPQKEKDLPISKRVKIGLNYEESLGDRQGVRSDLLEDAELFSENNNSHEQPCKNFYDVADGSSSVKKASRERKNEKAAKLAGFSNVTSYVQAKKVYSHGIRELIQATDEEKITIDLAARLATESEDIQYDLLQKSTKVIRAFFKSKPTGHSSNNFNPTANAIESESAYEKLLHSAIASLFIYNAHYKKLSEPTKRRGCSDKAYLKTSKGKLNQEITDQIRRQK